jgi:hypothetical protein
MAKRRFPVVGVRASQASGMTETHALASIKFWRGQGLGWISLVFLPVVIFFAWFADIRACILWSVAAAAYAGWIGLHGWTPWRMPVYEAYESRSFDGGELSPIQKAVFDFLHSRRIRFRSAAIVATAMITPWIVLGAKTLVQSRRNRELNGWALGLGIGFLDAIRTGTIAMRYMTGEVLKNWDRIKEEARIGVPGGQPVSTESPEEIPADYGSMGHYLRSRNVSTVKAVLWFVLSLIGVALYGYLRGRARRHGL